jgi:uncharacterized membrane protein YfcA
MELIAIYLIAGVAAGLVSGLFGLGGGLTIVPALAFALPLEGVTEKYVMHLAIGTSLVVMVVTALYTTVLRHRRGDLDWTLFWCIAPRVVIGAVLGAICADLLPGLALRVFFIGFVSYTIARALHRRYGAAVKSADSEVTRAPAIAPGGASLWIYGLATGVCGALLGAGAAGPPRSNSEAQNEREVINDFKASSVRIPSPRWPASRSDFARLLEVEGKIG